MTAVAADHAAEPPAPPRTRSLIAFATIAASYLFYSYTWATVDTLRPWFIHHYGLSLVQVSYLPFAQNVGALLGSLIAAVAASRFGVKSAMVGVTAGYGALLMIDPLMPGLGWLIVHRLLLGACLGGVFGSAAALYVGLFEPHQRARAASALILMYSASPFLMGQMIRTFGLENPILFWIGGAGGIATALLMALLIPRGTGGLPPRGQKREWVMKPMFSREHRGTTLRIFLLVTFYFMSFDAFSGWIGTYLKQVKELSDADYGLYNMAASLGSMTGNLAWGAIADRFGRRTGAYGHMIAGGLVVAILLANAPMTIIACGVAFSLGVGAGCILGPMFAEQYPEPLRPAATSLYHWGHILTFPGPTVFAFVAEAYGLGVSLAIGAGCFLLIGLFWLSLRETLPRRTAPQA